MELDAVSIGPQEVEVARKEINVLKPLLDEIVTDGRITTEAARDELKEQFENLESTGDRPFERQAIEFGRRSFQNFVGELLRRAYAPVRSLARQVRAESGVAWKGLRDGAYKAAGAALITGAVTDMTGVTKFTSTFIQFVTTHSEMLIAYVTNAFQNPTLVDIIHWIVWLGK
ncbi:MAG TPA: hypothetical protein VK591_16330 [Xanthobacteraceae bacterium]|nr:hypothetical protein [Xanthobacteraceae bacterium]